MARRTTWAVLLAGGALLLAADRAGAEATDPPNATGECRAFAEIEGYQTIDPYRSSGVYEIPLSGTARYEGATPGGGEGIEVPERQISGEVVIKTPPGIPDIQLTDAWSWNEPATGTFDAGTVDWDLPSALPRGVPFRVEGYHAEEGITVCEGYVDVEVEGGLFDSPFAPVSLGGTALAAAGLGLAMVKKGGPR